ncbi:MAG: glucose-6-phosphate isomerase [Pseudomonadota bacterium]
MASSQAQWAALQTDKARLEKTHLRDLFDSDPERFDRLSAQLDDLLIDFSCEKIDADALAHLFSLADATGVKDKRDVMFAGARINSTEDRAVMHVALRAEAGDGYTIDGETLFDQVEEVRARFLSFAEDVRNGRYVNADGAPFTDVINIGIGGSDLGPVMAVRALSDFADGPNVHFVSNVDGAHLSDVTNGLNPKTTLILIASKTFTTIETITNATAAKAWLLDAMDEDAANQNLVALSTNLDGTAAFGIDVSRVFGFWDWVGGRYSMCSAIGLSIALAVGADDFKEMLRGFRDMDHHFRTAPMAENLPVLMALIGIWRRNIMGCPTIALLPYDQRMEFFSAYVQQMDMESNGKRVTLDGAKVAQATSPVIWGTPGTNAQHSYFQMIHQGTDPIPVDFIMPAIAPSPLKDQHDLLTANMLAQAQALAFGKTSAEVEAEMVAAGKSKAEIAALVPHRTFPGDRPSTTIIYRDQSPYSLGRLIALYEHKVFVQGAIWGVNSFDQWGVELGKVLAKEVQPLLAPAADRSGLRANTVGIIDALNRLKS